jgi:hypothetical protein
MNNCLPLPIPGSHCKPLGRSAQGHTEAGRVCRKTAQSVVPLSLGCSVSILRCPAEAKSVFLVLFRVLGAVAQWLRPSPKGPAKDQLLLHSAEGHSQGEAWANDLGSASAIAEPSRNRHDTSFRGIWAQSKSGARFERRRLMRMTHRIPDEHSR